MLSAHERQGGIEDPEHYKQRRLSITYSHDVVRMNVALIDDTIRSSHEPSQPPSIMRSVACEEAMDVIEFLTRVADCTDKDASARFRVIDDKNDTGYTCLPPSVKR
ncbi:unnamed protein product [Vitrella brassicaformis CCMP3155]|uniref:Uncharacterized protein n=1 Tax=Vitrella brassicaformis (strain CCMP3155) TaxID=1169540 RepID=A0A0G4FEY5_VITBC|nr:unnamed protein product [Vitrella brassicaformis CCMP3155]|eukprot:CEM11762.1 unnamed protein product [Vitrella brassicaformis CCMP3155]